MQKEGSCNRNSWLNPLETGIRNDASNSLMIPIRVSAVKVTSDVTFLRRNFAAYNVHGGNYNGRTEKNTKYYGESSNSCWPYPSMHCSGGCLPPGGVPAWGVPALLPRGVSAQGMCLPRGCACPGGACPGGCLPSIPCNGADPPPPWTDRHLWKHNLRKLRLRAVIMELLHIGIATHFQVIPLFSMRISTRSQKTRKLSSAMRTAPFVGHS